MKKERIKIKRLARELGVTSRRVLDWCRSEGIGAQNSASVVDPQSEQRIRAHFAKPAAEQ